LADWVALLADKIRQYVFLGDWHDLCRGFSINPTIKKEVPMANVVKLLDWTETLPERMRTLQEVVERMFNETASNFTRMETFVPRVDIVETDKEYAIHLAVPGMKKEDFKIEVSEGRLVVSGERKFQKEEGDKKTYHRVETQYGNFLRTFLLPEDVKPEGITAEYVDGILKVSLPKDEKKAQAVRIEVK
jgi:HSP20 family protein